MMPHRAPYPLEVSPHSSNGGEGSAQNTPDTTLTAFSPEDIRPTRLSTSSSAGGAALESAGSNDPFVTLPANAKGKGKVTSSLSAKASSFSPMLPALPFAAAASFTEMDILRLTNSGTFTTDTKSSRNLCIDAVSVFKPDTNLGDVVSATLEEILNGRHSLLGPIRKKVAGHAMYLRCSDVRDASAIYLEMKKLRPEFAVEFVDPSIFKSAASPTSDGYSVHEGQVVLTVKYPAGLVGLDKTNFEYNLRKLLANPGDLRAFQKLDAQEFGTFRMVAEFYNCEKAIKRVKALDGTSVKLGGSGNVILSLKLHEPDLDAQREQANRGGSPLQESPTRGGGNVSLDKAFDRLNMGESFAKPAGMSYMTANGIYPPANGMIMGSPYGAGMGMNPYPGMYSGSMSAPGPIMASPYAYGAYAPAMESYHNPGFQGGYVDEYIGNGGYEPHYGSRYGQGPRREFDTPSRYESGSLVRRGESMMASSSRDLVSPTRQPARQYSVQIQRPRGRSTNQSSAHHNHVDIERISMGIDVRTTVMLRNIPNKLNQKELKKIVDSSSFGSYDFMYLRIDFSNNCNVGYAFINFTDPLDIIRFVEARSNKKWEKSDKVAEVSYATIQGKDCLVQKFRNSSVMLEPPHCRPKLFFTHHTAYEHPGMVGMEEAFPPSDNPSKLKRSCENAEHVGLFAPSAGQHMRDEQRRRKSQYDRGTSLAEREEFGDYGYDEPYSPYGYHY